MTQSVLIDTDPGVDDALALLLALHSPDLDVKAITTVCGNVDVHTATSNLYTVLDLLPGPYPVLAKGAERPLFGNPSFADRVHGANGLGGKRSEHENKALISPDLPSLSSRPGAEEILYQVEICHQPLTLVTLGPLTNIALALDRAPDLGREIRGIVMMGGAYTGPGNITPAAEFNIFADPEAADLVLRSGLPITAVGLDVTRQVRLDRETLKKWVQASGSSARQKIQEWTGHSLNYMHELDGEASIPLHDPLAVLVCMQPDLVSTANMHVVVETKGESTRGMTLADRRPILQKWKKEPNLRVCTRINSRQSLNRFLEGIP
ncbi:MAG: nucleoside hydrolase [Desulfovermiculus sp.]|nr:nucleoside hydrolase [Desulfovermiculus sp.]